MKTIIVLLLCVNLFMHVSAQDGYGSTSVYDRVVKLPKDKHIFRIMPNEGWETQRWKDSVYAFPSFQEGKLETEKGYTLSIRPMLNFNMLLGTIEIASPDKAISTLRQTPEIKFVWIGDHKFIYNPGVGYLEIIYDGKASLAQKRTFSGVYEPANGFLYSLNTTNSNDNFKGQVYKSIRYYWIDEQYFFVDEHQKISRATSGVLTKMLPSSVKKQVKEFSKEKNIDYRKKEDLLKITEYANGQVGN